MAFQKHTIRSRRPKLFKDDPDPVMKSRSSEKRAPPKRSLKTFDTSHHDAVSRAYWMENKIHLCTQDQRLTEHEFEIIVGAMTRIFGRRVVV